MTQPAGKPRRRPTVERERAADGLWQVLLAVDQGRHRIAKHHGINATDLSTLSHLHAHDGLGQVELADYLYLNPSSVVTVVDRLEAKHLVTRTRHPDDRRRTIIRITDRGRHISREHRACYDTALLPLSDEQVSAVADALHHVTDHAAENVGGNHDGRPGHTVPL